MQFYHQALKPGTILQGDSYTYRIESVLGQGSFGITYLATTRVKVQGALGELETDMQIAVKEFFLKEMNSREVTGVVAESSQGSLADKYGRKFLKEAENLSHLHHPNIVRVLEVFSTNHTHYYAMEYVKGGSLDDYIKEWKGLPEKEAIKSIRTIGNALVYMHSCKMLHLDLKPRNIMRRDDGNLYLIDFGISKQYDAKGEPESCTTIGLGTPGYAPIEQGNIQDSKDFAVTLDIYALGATLYKMLTGQTPPNASVVMNEGFPEEELRKRNISEQTIGAIRQAMAPMKRVRPQSVEAFLESLGDKQTIPNGEETVLIYEQREKEEKKCKKIEIARQKQQEIKRPNRKRKQNRLIKGAVGVAIAVVLAVFIWFISRPDDTTNTNLQAQLAAVPDSLVSDSIAADSSTMVTSVAPVQPVSTEIDTESLYKAELKAAISIYNKKLYGSAKELFNKMLNKYLTHQSEIKRWITKCNAALKKAPQIQDTTTTLTNLATEESTLKTNSNEPSEGKLIDLGLSVKWAAYNVGASSPEGRGGLFGWADPTGEKISKYNDDYPSSDPPRDISGTEYDIARSKWGDSWRLPKQEEFEELSEQCKWEWITYKETEGYLVIGPNKNSIFFPAVGWSALKDGTITKYRMNTAAYWSGTLKSGDNAYGLYFYNGHRDPSYSINRSNKRSVRPVSE